MARSVATRDNAQEDGKFWLWQTLRNISLSVELFAAREWRTERGACMPKKSRLSEAADTVKTVAGAALGAAAIAATGVVVAKVAGAIREGGRQLEDSTPELQRL